MDHSWGYGSEQRLREKNEDSYGVFDFRDYTLAVVCDGMGGHVGGAHASTLAVRTIHDTMRELQNRPVAVALEEAIQRTNLVIYEAARKNHRLTGMGTTVVVAVIMRDTCILAHVGDSRAYLVRRGQVQLLTRDHTMVNLFVDAELLSPEDAATHPEAHVLSRSLGVERQVEVDISDPFQLEPGDLMFLCTDGVHGVVTDWELGNVDWSAPHEATREILRIVASREGDDNATAVSVFMGSTYEDVPPTPVPEPRRYDEAGGGGSSGSAGMTAVPPDEEIEPPTATPQRYTQTAPRAMERERANTYQGYDEAPIQELDDRGEPTRQAQNPYPSYPSYPMQQREAEPTPVTPESRKPKPAQPARPKPAAPKPRGRSVLPVVVGVVLATAMLMCGIGITAVVIGSSSGGGAGTGEVAEVAPPAPQDRPPGEVGGGAESAGVRPTIPATPEEQWATADRLRTSGDLGAAAALLRELVASGDAHPFGDRALLALLEVQRQRMVQAGHLTGQKPSDAPPEQTLEGGVTVFGLTEDRRAFVDAANAVLSHNFAPPADPNAPNLAKLTEDQRPKLLLELGELMCLHNRYDEARTRLRELEDNHKATRHAEQARKLPKVCREADEDTEIYPCPPGGFMVKDELPPGLRRLHRTTLYCNQPPPGGRHQQDAIQKQRAGDCPGSLTAVQEGMKISEDHCRLYTLAWNCFTEEHLRDLEREAEPLESWDDIVLVLPELEGSREKRELQAKEPPWSRLPSWYREAPDGLEFRLEQWSKDPKMQDATADLFGAPTVADQITKDLFVEARLAVQLACMPPDERTSKLAIEEAWARRVYVLSRALNGPAGVLIKTDRPDMLPTLRSMMARAVSDYVDERGRRTPIPQVVRDAYDVGIGNRAPPTGTVARPKARDTEFIPDDEEIPQVQINRVGSGAGQ